MLSDVEIKEGHVYHTNYDFVKESVKRHSYSKGKLILARKYAGILSRIPWFRMIAVSGAVASNNATKDDDIDLFVIVSPKRLWLARFFDWLVLNIIKVRRNANSKTYNNKLCVNYYLSESFLTLKNQDLYIANEIVQLVPLYGEEVYKKFVHSNAWIKKYFANFWENFDKQNGDLYENGLPFRFVLFDFIEIVFKYLQIWHMKKKITKEIVSDKELRFHPKDVRGSVLKRYEDRIKLIMPSIH